MTIEVAMSSVLTKLRSAIYEKKRENKSWWNGEDIIKGIATKTQRRIENCQNIDSAKKDFTEAIDIYGKFFLDEKKLTTVSNMEIFDSYRTLKNQFPNRDFDELDIETYSLSLNPGDPQSGSPKLREKALEYIQKKVEETTMAYLFIVAHQEFGAIPFDKDKQLRQIRAVYHMLSGDHVAMDTGDGKTSVVIPIFSIVKTLLYPLDRLPPTFSLSGAENKTTQEMREKVQEYTKYINVGVNNIENEKTRKALSWKISLAATIPDYQKNTNNDPLLKKLTSPIPAIDWARNLGANIGFIPHSEMVFNTTDLYTEKINQAMPFIKSTQGFFDPQHALTQINRSFEKNLPTFVVDEAHLLRQSYTTETGRLSKEKIKINLSQPEIKDALCQYLTLRLFHEELLGEDRKKFVERVGGEGQLTSKGQKKVSGLIRDWFKDIENYQNGIGKTPGIVRRIKKIINQEIITNFEVKGDFSSKKLVGFFQEFIDIRKKDKDFEEIKKTARAKIPLYEDIPLKDLPRSFNDQIIIGLIDEYLGVIGSLEKGIDYLTPELLRDYLRGVILPSHHFSSDVSFFLSALEGQPYLSEKRNLDYDIDFYTWLALINRGNIIALSNDLYYTDPETGERILSKMGRALETYTEGKVVDLTSETIGRERVSIPSPTIIKGFSDLTDKISHDIIEGKRPEMVVCWNENTAKELFEKLQNQGKKVVLIDSQTDNETADLYHNQFANYEIDVLLTTGRKSFAADFKDKNNRFTDFRVSVVNPETIFQIGQAFGRRRLPKAIEDFSLYFEQEELLFLASSVIKQERELPFFQSILGKADPLFKELENLTENKKPDNNQQLRLKKIVIEILRLNQNKIDRWSEELIMHKVTFIQDIIPKVKQEKTKIFYKEISNENLVIVKLIENQLDRIKKKFHLSQTVIKKLRSVAINAALISFAQVDEQLMQDYILDSLFMTYNPAISKNEVVFKDILIKKFEQKIKDYYANLWKNAFDQKGFYIQQVLQNQINEELTSYARLLRQLPPILKQRGLTTSDIEDFYLLYSPPFQPANDVRMHKNTAVPTSATHGQKIGTDEANRRYILSQTGESWLLADEERFEKRLTVLNRVRPDFFKQKKFVDLYYQGQEPTSMFLRVILKK